MVPVFLNKFKTLIIVGLIFALLSVIVYYITDALGYGEYAVIVAVGFSLLLSLGSYWNSDKIVISANRAKPADEMQKMLLMPIMERICANADIPMPKMYVMNDASPNAFATGRNPKHAAVCVTTGLLSRLNNDQIEGVLAHEASHIKNYDILLSTIASVMIGSVIMISDILRRSLWFGSARRRSDKNNSNVFTGIIMIVLIILAPIAGQLMRFALSRNREYLADATAVKITGKPECLASALEVIGGISMPVKDANSATANMFFSDPVLKANGNVLSGLFATHPPIEKRVQAIRDLK